MSALNPPDSPPKAPVIPEGLATKLGKWGALALLILGAFLEIADINVDKDALYAGAAAVVTLLVTIAGRMAQAAAIYRDAPSPLQGATAVLGSVESWIDGEPDGVTYTGDDEDLGDEVADTPVVPPGLGGDAR